jgi:DNA-binding response OmpR family regulator
MSRIVLIVEDSEQCAVTLEIALLAIPNIIVSRFASGEQALDFLERTSGNVCAILTDLNMPRMDGLELVKRIRSCRLHSTVPIIVLSADSDPATPERARESGADAYFPKPFSPAQVRKKLEQLLNAPLP